MHVVLEDLMLSFSSQAPGPVRGRSWRRRSARKERRHATVSVSNTTTETNLYARAQINVEERECRKLAARLHPPVQMNFRKSCAFAFLSAQSHASLSLPTKGRLTSRGRVATIRVPRRPPVCCSCAVARRDLNEVRFQQDSSTWGFPLEFI